MNWLWRWATRNNEEEFDESKATHERIISSLRDIDAGLNNLKDENSESFFEIAALRKQLAETETDRLQWKREAEVSRLHLAGERRSNAALRGQITKLKGKL